jgi:hypothetical protein
MAYVAQQDSTEEDLTQPVVKGVDSAAGASSSNITTAGSGAASPMQASTTAAPSKAPSSGTFTDIKSYLNANQPGAENLGNQVSGAIDTSTNTAKNTINGATNDFRSQVIANTNQYNSDLTNAAANDPTAYLQNNDLKKELSGTYSGPTSFENSAAFGTANKAAQDAAQTAQLGTSGGGRQSLINQTMGPSTRGDLNLNQFLLEGTQPALGKVLASAQAGKNLNTDVLGGAKSANDAATQAAQTNQQTRQQALQALQAGQTNLRNTVGTQLTAAQADTQRQNDALLAFLRGEPDPGARVTIPKTPDQATAQSVQMGNGYTDGTMTPTPVAEPPASEGRMYIPERPGMMRPLSVSRMNDGGGDIVMSSGITDGSLTPTPVAEPAQTNADGTPVTTAAPAAQVALTAPSIPTITNPTPAQAQYLASLGLTVDQYNSLVVANSGVSTLGGHPLDLTQFFTAGTGPTGLGGAATADQVAKNNAFNSLIGSGAGFDGGAGSGPGFRMGDATNAITSMLNSYKPGANGTPGTWSNPGFGTGGPAAGGTDVPGNTNNETGGGGDGGSGGSASSGTSGPSGGPAVGVSVSDAVSVAVSVAAAVAAPTPSNVAQAVNSIANAISNTAAANAAADAANTDSNPDATDADGNANSSVSPDSPTATDGPAGTGGAAAAAAAAAASAATADGASPAAAAAAGQAAADASVDGASPAAAAAAGAAAAAAASAAAAAAASTTAAPDASTAAPDASTDAPDASTDSSTADASTADASADSSTSADSSASADGDAASAAASDGDASSSSSDGDGGGGGGGGAGGGCVVATALVRQGKWNPDRKGSLISWCEDTLHGKSIGEALRRGYQVIGSKVIVPNIRKGGIRASYLQWQFEQATNLLKKESVNLASVPLTALWVGAMLLTGAVVSTKYARASWKQLYKDSK